MYTCHVKKFNELTLKELYSILQLRNKCFIVDQQIPYQDLDNYDQKSYHILLLDDSDNSLVSYTRLIEPGVRFEEPSCGRFCTNENYRVVNHHVEVYNNLIKLLENIDYNVMRCIIQKKYYSLWKRVTREVELEIDKEIIEDGVESYEVILRR